MKYPAHWVGRKRPKFHARWSGMNQRCYNASDPSYEHYGARGIFVCAAWRTSYLAFHLWCEKTFQEGRVLDRRNNDGPYSPSNCRWVSTPTSNKNRRFTPKMQTRVRELAKEAHAKFGNPKTRKNKFCGHCKNSRTVSAFNKCKKAPDGLQGYCGTCQRELLRARRR